MDFLSAYCICMHGDTLYALNWTVWGLHKPVEANGARRQRPSMHASVYYLIYCRLKARSVSPNASLFSMLVAAIVASPIAPA